MSKTRLVLDPTAPPDAGQTDNAARPLDTLAGKVVGFIDNSKPNFNLLADDLAALLSERYGVASVVRHRKLKAASPASSEIMEDVGKRCDLVLVGSAD